MTEPELISKIIAPVLSFKKYNKEMMTRSAGLLMTIEQLGKTTSPVRSYNIIYADPPWHYRDKASAGKRGACYKYPVMNLRDIKNLHINKICAENCMLFLWTTMPFLDKAFEVIKAWGFKYKTCAFVWVKKNKKADTWFWGMGNWTRSNAELCLLATKGKPKRLSAKVHSVVDARIMGHSRKPDEVRNRIVELCGDIPRIELFAREKHQGWDAWGNEI